ncbi:hypothetical protein DACRYDRAFT_110044 [Dacryopinax primogenitus]|uniref:ABM domain-containing protein n=1 Tax=Dacryopinax primogenitus (strain DJM 731) TaxID=1858805 RepID=M5G0G9_DACPD|nr:uncharacterized protein DACRYDRAFT_110044 [Dacryopinax primogenitus]EJT99326.1 hypothetical protein DACRYDRAFT_110044 [Dacryopinax primogenitus]
MSSTPSLIKGRITVIGALTVKDGKLQELLGLLGAIKEHLHNESGTLHWEVDRFENEIGLIEKYRDSGALEVHMSSPQYQAFAAKASELIVEGSISVKYYGSEL